MKFVTCCHITFLQPDVPVADFNPRDNKIYTEANRLKAPELQRRHFFGVNGNCIDEWKHRHKETEEAVKW